MYNSFSFQNEKLFIILIIFQYIFLFFFFIKYEIRHMNKITIAKRARVKKGPAIFFFAYYIHIYYI